MVERFDSPAEIRRLVRRPTVATAMKRVVEASRRLPNKERFGSRRDAYVKTLGEPEAIDPDDDDEGIRVVADWIRVLPSRSRRC